jgi:hypothetical protein
MFLTQTYETPSPNMQTGIIIMIVALSVLGGLFVLWLLTEGQDPYGKDTHQIRPMIGPGSDGGFSRAREWKPFTPYNGERMTGDSLGCRHSDLYGRSYDSDGIYPYGRRAYGLYAY